jgi:MoaA/NifB/PqqE/SkfB family radical SAM enzyme
MTASGLATAALVRLGELTNRTFVLPLLVFFPTSRCNSRCVSCDWWKSSGADDLSLAEIAALAESLPALGARLVVFSGGEPLLRPDVFEAARLFRANGLMLHLLTSGVLLEKCAPEVAAEFLRVIVSLDASTDGLYYDIRGVNALNVVEKGVARLRRIAPAIPVTARATLHRMNFRELPRLIDHAKAMALDGISFLPADVSSSAFGRSGGPRPGSGLLLDDREVDECAAIVERTIAERPREFESGFIAESPAKLRRIPQYFEALAQGRRFAPAGCNAPWVSAVVEANGAVRPCFFHEPIGSIREAPLATLIARELPRFRQTLDVATNPVCGRCVCSTTVGWRNLPWQ